MHFQQINFQQPLSKFYPRYMEFLRRNFIPTRYNRRQLFFIFFLLCLFTTFFKIYTYLASSKSEYAEFPSRVNLDDVRQLLLAAEETGVNVTLFDPVILQAWKDSGYAVSPGTCLFLCSAVGPLAFAVTKAEVTDKPVFVATLRRLGFTVLQFFNDEGYKSHLLLLRSGAPLHINVLHWSDAGYWRQYQLYGSPHHVAVVKQFLLRDSLALSNVDRAFERFETNKTVVDGFKLSVPADIDRFSSDHASSQFIPCNEVRAAFFYAQYPEDTSPKAKEFQDAAWKVLAKSKAVLDDLGIPFCISSGTLLGFFRQCRIVPWSKDVDLGISIEDYHRSLIPSFEAKGLEHIQTFGKINDSLELSFREHGVKVDVFFFYAEGDTVWAGSVEASTGRKFKNTYPASPLCWTEFLSLKVRLPCRTETYIKSEYGQDWFTPAKSWDWMRSPSNVVLNGEWAGEEKEERLYVKRKHNNFTGLKYP